ncbi:MAG: aminodeoxychorismate/anthranilate synthase component II [Candidatus Peribacteraceae bacterium]|nr:aminodeoxychorismate/anthranilate synthase component II [Candidatus Peribacteraceae bacterium]
MRTLILDNYDSFTFNLYQEAGMLDGKPEVIRNDQIDIPAIAAKKFTHLIISPGPGNPDVPRDIGISEDLIEYAMERDIPLLGVCLGHQIMGKHFGAKVVRCKDPYHGKASKISLAADPGALFKKIPSGFSAMRYHSLCVTNLPACLRPTAKADDDGTLMAMEYTDHRIFGVQFHPESIGTPDGMTILKNFLSLR